MIASQSADPLDQFTVWFAEAEKREPGDANAMTVATAGPEGRPTARMVLLKAFDARGFVFYTNLASRKSAELAANPYASLLFHWKSLERQVRIEGPVEPVTDAEADDYFATRNRLSQIGAWASKQSQPLNGRFELERQVARFTAKFHVGKIPRPDFWSGFRVIPERIEFWQAEEYRLHNRLVYIRDGDGWRTETLYP
ncbi:MAG TPA: pyridoxamine 5'-phosphate oxidase [Rhodospirillales bacterium]|jgi:pyridoxamine 5'-phosphate oxidase|nr:pyridoxamine 5'-phosphate oxidase [Rhodospirillales bacterium]HJO68198.1 pyridoxamine 5'-phosphate oxidase [Rhodospirillales bacterium]